MLYTAFCPSPLGKILLATDDTGLTGLWFEGQKYYAVHSVQAQENSIPILKETKKWLEIYFSGRDPDFCPPLHPAGSNFQMAVWSILRTIPYGKTMTYGEIAKQLNPSRMSAQAVGGAVSRNPISILIPCHRVIGAGGSLTGYAGGLDKKAALLKLEGAAFISD